MIAGHFALAAGVKAGRPTIPLWSLMLATVWLDVVFVPLFAAGIEKLEPAPGAHGHYGSSLIYADYTHSLLGALALSAIFGLFFLRPWGRQAAVVLAAVSFSHWALDLIVHRPDLPLLPGNLGDLPRLGLGLWRAPVAAGLVEAALILGGTYLYWRAAKRATTAAGNPGDRRPLVIGVLFLASGLITLALNAFTE